MTFADAMLCLGEPEPWLDSRAHYDALHAHWKRLLVNARRREDEETQRLLSQVWATIKKHFRRFFKQICPDEYKAQRTCPQCGKTKTSTAALCYRCHYPQRRWPRGKKGKRLNPSHA